MAGEFMSYHPSSPPQANTSGSGVLRVLGALLSLVSAMCAILGAVFQHSALSLIFSAFIALFAVRVFMLWLGSHRVSSQRTSAVAQQAMYPTAQYYAGNQAVAQGYNQHIPPGYNGG